MSRLAALAKLFSFFLLKQIQDVGGQRTGDRRQNQSSKGHIRRRLHHEAGPGQGLRQPLDAFPFAGSQRSPVADGESSQTKIFEAAKRKQLPREQFNQ